MRPRISDRSSRRRISIENDCFRTKLFPIIYIPIESRRSTLVQRQYIGGIQASCSSISHIPQEKVPMYAKDSPGMPFLFIAVDFHVGNGARGRDHFFCFYPILSRRRRVFPEKSSPFRPPTSLGTPPRARTCRVPLNEKNIFREGKRR